MCYEVWRSDRCSRQSIQVSDVTPHSLVTADKRACSTPRVSDQDSGFSAHCGQANSALTVLSTARGTQCRGFTGCRVVSQRQGGVGDDALQYYSYAFWCKRLRPQQWLAASRFPQDHWTSSPGFP
ncbi:hypothetical protein E2C01_046560 [Portunus trituberculatus]|uniref:Uncharacterized protein n=1 Tax=Portunus trituberculatus TaxID=210409 RepID=A0A5B7G829_PORTR|nr:hypothetical protein [Portunus trituberculatus]